MNVLDKRDDIKINYNSTKNYPISMEYSDVIVIYHYVIFHVGETSCS